MCLTPIQHPSYRDCSRGYATGTLSLKEVARKAQAAGLVYRKSGTKLPVSTVHTILRNRLYTGWFEWNGKIYEGRHEPLVSTTSPSRD